MIQKLTNKLNDRKNNKGFTLVELIVVIVILAILAAILIPGLLKWIDEAKDKQYQLEARSIYLATQAEIAKGYTGGGVTAETVTINSTDARMSTINELSALTVDTVKYTITADGQITSFETKFTSSDSTTVTMEWTAAGNAWKKVTTP